MKDYGQHKCNGIWRGTKRQIYEGGHRVPLLVKWPDKVAAASVSHETVCLTDFFATFAKLLNQKLPVNAGEDSYDISKILLGKPYKSPLREATVHHSVSGQFAIRQGDWKLIEGNGDGDYPRDTNNKMIVVAWNPTWNTISNEWENLDYFNLKSDGKFQLYNLKSDPKEEMNIAHKHPDKLISLKNLLNKYRDNPRSVTHQNKQYAK